MPDLADLRKYAGWAQAQARATLQFGALIAVVLAGVGVWSLVAGALANGLQVLGLAALVFVTAAYLAYAKRIYARTILSAVTNDEEVKALANRIQELERANR